MIIKKLISGDPDGGGSMADYTFEEITVEGDEEARLMAQLQEWVLSDSYTEDMLTSSGDFYGCGISDTIRTSLAKYPQCCFIHNGELVGYIADRMILFLNGKALGRTTYSEYGDDFKRSGKYSLERKS